MIEKIALRMFWTFMLLCASTALTMLWLEPFITNEAYFKLIPTFFIIGFASFLVWSPLMAYRFLNK